MFFFNNKTLCFHQVLNASREGVTMQWTIYAHPLGPLGLTKSFSLLKNFFWKQPNVRSNTVWSKGLSRTSFHTSITTTRSLKITLDNFFMFFFGFQHFLHFTTFIIMGSRAINQYILLFTSPNTRLWRQNTYQFLNSDWLFSAWLRCAARFFKVTSNCSLILSEDCIQCELLFKSLIFGLYID